MTVPRCGNRDDGEESDVPAKVAQSQLPPNASEAEDHEQWNTTVPRGYARRGRRSVHLGAFDDIVEEQVVPVDRLKMIQDMDLDDIPSQQLIQQQKSVSLLQSLLRRDKRSTRANKTGFSAPSWVNEIKFSKEVITWKIPDVGLSSRLPESAQIKTIGTAFRMWSEVTPLKFVRLPQNANAQDVDIEVKFGRTDHYTCPKKFDGPYGELAHALNSAVHLDDDEGFTLNADNKKKIFLLKILVHEIGHVLGLPHVPFVNSVMFGLYQSMTQKYFELDRNDRHRIQRLYGKCRGKFHAIFDWTRKKKDQAQPIYNTYFFRKNGYWMYENLNRRTRYGDPHKIEQGWKGIPESPDAAVTFMESRRLATYFFKGPHVYHYAYNTDEEDGRLAPGYPKLITSHFGSKSDGNAAQSLPDTIDTVWYVPNQGLAHFIKGSKVYVYDLRADPRKGCCTHVSDFTTIYPNAPGTQKNLTGDIDVAYFRLRDRSLYFFQGDHVWKLYFWQYAVSNPSRYRLWYMGEWHSNWYDICDIW